MTTKRIKPGMCACGQPLHYTDARAQQLVEKLIAQHGETILVGVHGKAWLVPRHYIALHGLSGRDMPYVAHQYGFAQVDVTGHEPVGSVG